MAMFGLFSKDKISDSANQNTPTTDGSVNQSATVTTQTTTQSGGAHAYSGIGNPTASNTQSTTTTQTTTPTQVPPPPTQETPKLETTDKPAVAEKKDEPQITDNTKDNDNTKDDKQSQLDLMTHLTQRSNRVFMASSNKAKELQVELIDSEHLLHGLLTDPEIFKLFTEQKITPQTVEKELEAVYKKGNFSTTPQPSPRVKRILDNSLVTARKLGYEFISPEHILLSLYDEQEGAGARVLIKVGLKKEDLNKKIVGKKTGLAEGDGKGEARSTLEKYTTDLTAKALSGQLDPVVERSDVIERVIHILSRRTKNNPALNGEAGVGKTAVVEGLAQSIANKKVPESLLDKRVLQLDLMSVLAGASHRGEFEERMKHIIEEIKASQGKIILFIDEIHNLVGAGAGGESSLDASNFLKPSLARGELQVIGATTLTEYRKYIEKDPALERRFQPILVPEPTIEQSIKMLKSLRDKYEAFHRVKIPDDAIEASVKLSKRYVGDRFLPDKAVDLIDEAGSAVRLPLISLPEEIRSHEERVAQLQQEVSEAEKSGNRVKAGITQKKLDEISEELAKKRETFEVKKSQTTSEVTVEMIKDIISRWTNIPVSKIADSEIGKLTKLEDIMHERLINQEVAVGAVSQAVRRGRAGLKSTKRPIGSFVFLGPTGVGKTELAKTLAEVLFGQESAMIRFDMTEYMEKHEVAKLLGAPPGYVGYEEGGKLTEAVRRTPYSVVLFDEIEKAHPDIFNILLQILDDGRLSDNKGRVISFKNTVVICTSNIGTKMIQEEILKGGKEDIEEPTMLSTYTLSPRGRQVLTIMGKVFQKDSESGSWSDMMLVDYFAGQKIESNDEKKKEGESDFPGKEFDTQTISAQGSEIISSGETVWSRTSTTSKMWEKMSLIDYFKEHVVVNALPDAPEQQLPTARLKTHAFTPDETEIVTLRDRYWRRKENTKNWETGTLKDYFLGQSILGKQDSPESNETQIAEGTKVSEKPKESPPQGKEGEERKANFPVSYWDIHAFTPQGSELIIVADTVWSKDKDSTSWKIQPISEFFGADFPLDKELEEKHKIESELANNQYQKIKTRVMDELGKFFRPELINRFDEVIIFEPLRYHHMLKIVDLQLKSVKDLLEEQNIGFSWTKTAGKELVRHGFDPIFGARPLQRTIQKLVENPISSLIIEKRVEEGDSILVDFDAENFIFNIEKVSLIPENTLSGIQGNEKKYVCDICAGRFTTTIVSNSTTVCAHCGSEKVKQIVEETEEKLQIGKPPSEKTNDVEKQKSNISPQIDPQQKEDQPSAPTREIIQQDNNSSTGSIQPQTA